MTTELLRSCVSFVRGLHNERGQSMVEFVVAAPVLIIFLYAIWFISDMYVVKSQTLMAARYATWRLASLDQAGTAGLGVRAHYFEDNAKVAIEVVPGDEEMLNPVADLLNDVFAGKLQPGTFAVRVDYTMEPVLGGLDLSEENPAGFTIGYTHYVGGNSWHGCRTYVREMFTLLYSYMSKLSNL
jgi:Flp pilus assembly protein TadG